MAYQQHPSAPPGYEGGPPPGFAGPPPPGFAGRPPPGFAAPAYPPPYQPNISAGGYPPPPPQGGYPGYQQPPSGYQQPGYDYQQPPPQPGYGQPQGSSVVYMTDHRQQNRQDGGMKDCCLIALCTALCCFCCTEALD